MEYSFEFSAWIINFYYASWLNETSWDESEEASPNVDNCEPLAFLSPTLAISLALVPALVCAAQLPGSLLYHGHATFYRLSPVLGLADCFATYALVGKALAKGRSWRQSIAGVLLVRQGIGQNYLWWRKFGLLSPTRINESTHGSGVGDEDEIATLAPTESSIDWADHDDEEAYLRCELARITQPVHIERISGSVFILLILAEVVVLAVLAPMASLLKAIAIIALAYIGSLFMFEVLVWSLVLNPSGYSLFKIPWENAIELLCALDPGEEAPSPTQYTKYSRQMDTDIELESCHSRDTGDDRHVDRTMTEIPAWGITMKLIVGIFGMVEVAVWIVVVYVSWPMKPQLLIPAAATAIVSSLGLIINCLFPGNLHTRLGIIRQLDLSSQERNIAARLGLAALRWLLTKATLANLNAFAWLGLMVAIFTLERARDGSADGGEKLTALPLGLIWTA